MQPTQDRPLIEVRREQPDDLQAVRDVNQRAFGQRLEGDLVDALRTNQGVLLSLVATIDGQVVGHILYSPAAIGQVRGAALGPMAVVPDRQRQGVGSQLVQTGNQMMKVSGSPFIIVLGHPEFYPRFGFTPARALGITCAWDVPDDVFMVLRLDEAKTRGMSGRAEYRPEFSTVT